MSRLRTCALALTISLAIAACGGSDGAGTEPTAAAPTPTEAPSPSPTIPPGLWREGIVTREDLGAGRVEAAASASDGTPVILVSAPASDGSMIGDGIRRYVLNAVLPDGTRTEVLADDGSFVGGDVIVPAAPLRPGSPIAFLDGSEGFTGQVWIGTIGDDGIPTDLRLIAGFSAQLDDFVADAPGFTSIPDAAWSEDGTTFTMITSDGPLYDAGPDATYGYWSLDVASGAWTEVEGIRDGSTQIEQLDDGQFVTLADGEFWLAGQSYPAEGSERLVVSPDGTLITASGTNGIIMLDSTGFVRYATSVSVSVYGFFPDGSGIAFARLTDGDPGVTFYAVDLTTFEVTEYGDSAWAWFAVLPDMSGIAVTLADPDGGRYADPVAQRWNFPAA